MLRNLVVSFSLLGVKARNIIGCTNKHYCRLVNRLNSYGVCGLGCVVLDGELHRIGEVERHVALRSDGGVLAHCDVGHKLCDVDAARNKYRDGLGSLVDAAYVGAVELEGENGLPTY